MTSKARQEIASVLTYLRAGPRKIENAHTSFNKYIGYLLRSKTDLPFHYKIRIDELIKYKDPNLLASYLAQVLKVIVVVQSKKHFIVRGLKQVSNHRSRNFLYDFVEDEVYFCDYLDKNVSLNPTVAILDIKTQAGVAKNTVLISKSLKDYNLSFVGRASLDYELAIGVLKYIEN